MTHTKILIGLLRPHAIKRDRVVRQRQSPVVGLQRPGSAGEALPVRARQSPCCFLRLNAARSETAPVKLETLPLRNDGQVKRRRAEISDDSIIPESNFIF